ncbi:MAG: hypothetical protein C4526_09765 [Nitrospiraceae bacterium]|nr:MAG: hypothetical protein C4526_09765 [Nitrospiraceae bacterium]
MLKDVAQKNLSILMVLSFIICLFAVPAISEAAIGISSYDEPVLPNWPNAEDLWNGGEAYGINDSGIVIGSGVDNTDYGYKAFTYNGSGYTELLPSQMYSIQSVWFGDNPSINNNNVIAASGYNSTYSSVGFTMNTDGTGFTQLLDTGWGSSWTYNINDSNNVVGAAFTSDSAFDPTGFYYDGAYSTILPSGWSFSEATAVNSGNVVVGFGTSDPFGFDTTGFMWTKSGGFLSTSLEPDNWSSVNIYDINASGYVVGSGTDIDGTQKGFVYDGSTYTTLLPVIGTTWEWAEALGINSQGAIVGKGGDGTGTKGFLYYNGEYTEVLPSGWSDVYAYDINDNNVIVGSGVTGFGLAAGFTATASGIPAPPVVPEPVSSVLFVIGGALLAGRRFLKKRV